MLVAGWHIQSRMAIAQLQALAQERVAAIEKGVPLPPRETEPRTTCTRRTSPQAHSFGSCRWDCPLGRALPGPPSLGCGGDRLRDRRARPLVPSQAATNGSARGVMDEEMHEAYVVFEGPGLCLSFGRWPQGLTTLWSGAMKRTSNWPGGCGNGDAAAQRAFVDRFAVLVRSLCARSGIVGPDREDVAQQVLLDAFRALPRYRGTSRLSTWIYSLALRRRQTTSALHSGATCRLAGRGTIRFRLPNRLPDALAPDEQAVRRDEDRRVSRALARVAEPERAVLLAYYLGEMSVSEISRTLAIPEGTVKTRASIGDVRCCARNWARRDLRSISRSACATTTPARRNAVRAPSRPTWPSTCSSVKCAGRTLTTR